MSMRDATLARPPQPLEKAEMVREGSHCTILTYSRMRCVLRCAPAVCMRVPAVSGTAEPFPRHSYVVEQAVKEAVAAGYDPEVIDLISLKPFDQSAIAVCPFPPGRLSFLLPKTTLRCSAVPHAPYFDACAWPVVPELCAQDAPRHHR
jgi:pyruvate dehydrogenase E1 component beta subunit